MNKNNKTLFNPYMGVIIVFLLFSYFAYQGYLKDKIAEKVDGVTKTIHIQEQAKTYQDNLTSLTDIWINTNTIGSSLMTLALLITGFASSFGKWYMRLLSLPALILAGATIWVCQSKAALYALVIFVILEILPKKIFRNTLVLLDVCSSFGSSFTDFLFCCNVRQSSFIYRTRRNLAQIL